MRTFLGFATAVAAAALLCWELADPTPWQPGVLLAMALALVAVWLLVPELDPPLAPRRRRPRPGERSFRVEAWIPLSEQLHEYVAAQLADAGAADGLRVRTHAAHDDDEGVDVAIVSWLVVARSGGGAEEEARADLRRAGLIDDGVRVVPR